MTSGQATILFLVVCANSIALFWVIHTLLGLVRELKRIDQRTELHTKGLIKLMKWRGELINQTPAIKSAPTLAKLPASDGIPLVGHVIVVGESGSGKSNLVMGNIIRRLEAGQQVHIVDTKQELSPYFNRHCQIVTPEQAVEKVNELLEQADIRQKLFADTTLEHGKACLNIEDYARITGQQLNVICLLLEELVYLSKIIDMASVIKLLVIGRSAGIYVFAASQYLSAKILDRDGSINFTTRIFMGVWDKVSTGILFHTMTKQQADDFATFTGPPGRGIMVSLGKFTKKQFELVPKSELEKFI